MKLKTVLTLIAIIGCSLLLSGCLGGTLPPKGWSGPTVYNGSLYMGTMDGRILAQNEKSLYNSSRDGWKYPDVSSISYFYGTPVVVDDVVYAGAYSGKIYAINALNRNVRVYPSEGNLDSIVGGPVVANGILYIGCSDGNLYAINIINMQPAWGSPFKTGNKVWATPLVNEGVVYIGSFDHKMYAVNASNGAAIWASPFEARGAIAATPILYNGSLYFGSLDRRFYAVNASTGKEKSGFTPYQAGNWFWSQAVAYNGSVIAGCLDGKVYAFDAESGAVLWSQDTGGPIRGDLALVKDTIIAGSENGKVTAFNASFGDEIWPSPRTLGDDTPTQILASLYGYINSEGKGVVFVHAANQKIYALWTDSGNDAGKVSTSGE